MIRRQKQIIWLSRYLMGYMLVRGQNALTAISVAYSSLSHHPSLALDVVQRLIDRRLFLVDILKRCMPLELVIRRIFIWNLEH